jgi:hypothetical protein
MSTMIRNNITFNLLKHLKDVRQWARRNYAAPSPPFVKQRCLTRNGVPHATWVETGTYLGSTTRVLSKNAHKVYSIEPEPTLFANARENFRNVGHVEILHGTSEVIFPTLLPKITGDVNFWLDGHYSAGITFKGPTDTPIAAELQSIDENLTHFRKVTILVDDIRLFSPRTTEYSGYPPLDFLVDWARGHQFSWEIEHDIFVARNY